MSEKNWIWIEKILSSQSGADWVEELCGRMEL